VVGWVWFMGSQICPHCESSRVGKSPSGQHLVCLDCQRIIVQDRVKKPRGRRVHGKPRRPAPEPRPETAD
jgi:transcription initiation factor TFIIIB Brf1 subunit/transcription initiation factor TFIIB